MTQKLEEKIKDIFTYLQTHEENQAYGYTREKLLMLIAEKIVKEN